MIRRPPHVLSCGSQTATGHTRRHSHPGCEIIRVTTGSALVVAGDATFELRSGSILRMPAGHSHEQHNRTPLQQSYVVIDEQGPERPELIQPIGGEPVGRWIDDLARLHLAPGGSPETESALITAILARLDQLTGRAAIQHRLPAALAALVRHCESDPLDDRDETGLARIAGVSPAHLRHLCRTHLGVPPGEYRRNLRLQLAQKLLRSSYLDIAAVAAACGWTDANYFARLFRSRTGLSPRSFRRQYRV